MEKMRTMRGKGERERDGSRLALLPEPLIHTIQSFLTGKEAAQSSYLSNSWYDAWLTRPTLSFDYRDFKNGVGFAEFATRSMERYRSMNLRIESFSLRANDESCITLAMKLTADAIQIGATDLNIEVASSDRYTFVLPAEVLESETLARLGLRGGQIVARNLRCPRLKSLTLDYVSLEREDKNLVNKIISCCSTSIEEVSLCDFYFRVHEPFNVINLYELHKLRRLHLRGFDVGDSFFTKLESNFPWLKDLSLDDCSGHKGYSRIRIASTSLESISLIGHRRGFTAMLDVPNLRKFVYEGSYLPSLSFKARSRHQLEFDISTKWSHYHALPIVMVRGSEKSADKDEEGIIIIKNLSLHHSI